MSLAGQTNPPPRRARKRYSGQAGFPDHKSVDEVGIPVKILLKANNAPGSSEFNHRLKKSSARIGK
ncbi:MAG TPA: hypothetical protein DEA96_01110 [Leptospiraceae bacterium]|nr:hypothetical protein [Spirochaetaceae bacterium]HBS03532.1 hypothetical protein [Leptospiraceae bacterium]